MALSSVFGRGVLSFTLCFLFAAVSTQALGQTRATGAVFDTQTYLAVPAAPPLSRGDYLGNATRVSLKAHVPPVGDQGAQGSCVGWATAYAARTLLSAKEANISDKSKIRSMIFSPAFVFNQIDHDSCDPGGSFVSDALDLMSRRGVALMSDFPYDENECFRKPSAQVSARAKENKIKTYSRLWGIRGKNRHSAVRRAIADGHPVVIGMFIAPSFAKFEGELYTLTRAEREDADATPSNERPSMSLGGHAMTVIGYDDKKAGGALEIVNSWSDDWGNDGYFWIRYEDFNRLVLQGYEVIPQDPLPPPKSTDMAADIQVLHISGRELKARRSGNLYSLVAPLPSGARFRVETKSHFASNIYVIGGDDSGEYVELFPRSGRISPHISKNTTLLLPGPTETHFTRLNDTTGTDYYVVLAARNALNVDEVVRKMSAASGTVGQKLRSALGNRLVDNEDVEWSNRNIGFEAASGGADVVPVVIGINHVAPNPADSDKTGPLIVLTSPAEEAFDAAAAADQPIVVASRYLQIEGNAQDESRISKLTVDGAISARFSSRGPFRAELELPAGPGPHEVPVEALDEVGNRSKSIFQFIVKP